MKERQRKRRKSRDPAKKDINPLIAAVAGPGFGKTYFLWKFASKTPELRAAIEAEIDHNDKIKSKEKTLLLELYDQLVFKAITFNYAMDIKQMTMNIITESKKHHEEMKHLMIRRDRELKLSRLQKRMDALRRDVSEKRQEQLTRISRLRDLGLI